MHSAVWIIEDDFRHKDRWFNFRDVNVVSVNLIERFINYKLVTSGIFVGVLDPRYDKDKYYHTLNNWM